MAANSWEMMRQLASMPDRINRVWTGVHERGAEAEDVTSRGTWQPAVDIYQADGPQVMLKAELPGVRREDINLSVENNTLTIRGERRRDEGIKDEQYQRIEREYGAFARSFTIPNTIDAQNVRAEYRDGILTVVLPIRNEARPRQIQVEVTG
jgi:HSP20 family protein